jgi:putative membrane protein
MKKSHFKLWIAAGVIAFSMSCSNDRRNDTAENHPVGTPEDAREHNDAKFDDRAEKDANFVADAVQRNLATLSMCERVVMNNKDTAVNRITKMLYDYHMKKNTELTALAKKKNITVPMEADSNYVHLKAIRDKNGVELRNGFFDELIDDHKDAIDEYQKATENSADPEIRSFASNELTSLREHLDQLMNVRKTYDTKK